MISLEVTAQEARTIAAIVDRATELYSRRCRNLDGTSLEMDLTACHANDCPLDLERLLNADEFSFIHDIAGISANLDRDDRSPTGGQLLNHFLPRFAQRDPLPEAWMLTETEIEDLPGRDGGIAMELRA